MMNNKLKNTLLIVAAAVTVVCIVAGCLMNTGCFYVNRALGWDRFDRWGGEGREEKLLDEMINEDFDSLEARVSFGTVMIEAGDKNSIVVNATNKKYVPSIEIVDGKLTVIQAIHGANIPGEFNPSCDIIITVKEDKLKLLDATLSLGDLTVTELKADQMYCHMDLGNLTLDSCKAGRIDADNNLGDIELLNTDFEEADLRCDLGEVSVEAPFDIQDCQKDITVDLGEIIVGDKPCGNRYVTEAGSRKLTISNDLGDVNVY